MDKIEEQAVDCSMLGYPKAGSALEVKEAREGPVINAEVTEPLPKSDLGDTI
ncbi:hypothetical protein PCASD_25080 [Puccinia coronata f. sp. avenae]|uniref:Uncharacterized protein n=1 Tax=Puccinia coronata f. sp. avenae TaxID=200324 RepID=A0A2N5TUW6_9BASI|nr:hypothetical protein PCASD_25080 [Puccinia coronata f. sp. avenae]